MAKVSMLNLENNNIVDISPLAGLGELVVLGLGKNRISDLTPLRNLKPSLIGLSLEGNPIKDLKQLRPLSNLEVLDLTGVPITDVDLGNYLRRLKVVVMDETRHGLDDGGLWQFKAGLPPNCEVKIEKADGKQQ